MAFGIPTDERGQKLFFLGFLGVAGAIGYWYGMFETKRVDMVEIRARLDTVDSLNKLAKAQIAKGNTKEINATTERSRNDLARLRVLVPAGAEVSALIDQISNSARRVNLEIGPVDPEPVIEGELFDTHRYRMKLTGSYHDIAAVLANVGSLGRIVAPVNLQLVIPPSAQVTKQSPGKQTVVATFMIQTAVVRTAPPKVKVKPKRAPGAPAAAKAEGGA